MSRLPRFPEDAKATGKDLNHILAILDAGGVANSSSATNSGVTGDGLSGIVPQIAGSISTVPGSFGSPATPRGFTGSYGIDNYSQSHTAFALLTWTPNPVSDFVSRYDIYYHKGNDPTLYNLTVGGDVNSVRVNNLFAGNTYSFAIQAHDAASRSSSWSPEITVNISLDTDPPAIPSGLTAVGTTRGVFLTWTEVGSEGISNDLKQYQIAISTDGGGTYPTVQKMGPGNAWFYSYTSDNPSEFQKTIFFKIASVDWTGNVSGYSSSVSAVVGGLSWDELIPSSPTTKASILYSDDFELAGTTATLWHSIGTEAGTDNSMNYWGTVSGSGFSYGSHIITHAAGVGNSILSGGSQDWNNLNGGITFQQRVHVGRILGTGIGICIQSNGDGFYVRLGTNTIQAFKRSGGTFTSLAGTQAFTWTAGGAVWLKLNLNGTTLTYSAATDSVGSPGAFTDFTVTDSSFTTGTVALLSNITGGASDSWGGPFTNVCIVTGPVPAKGGSNYTVNVVTGEPAFAWSGTQAYFGLNSLSIQMANSGGDGNWQSPNTGSISSTNYIVTGAMYATAGTGAQQRVQDSSDSSGSISPSAYDSAWHVAANGWTPTGNHAFNFRYAGVAGIAYFDEVNVIFGNNVIGGLSVVEGSLNLTEDLSFQSPASRIIPGVSSLLIRNNANNASNLLITDSGSTTIRTRIISAITSLTDAATVAVDASLGNSFILTATSGVGATRAIGSPSNSANGQRISFTFIQDVTGGRALTWNAVFKVSWSDTGNTANKRSSIAFIYDGTNWNQDGAQTPYV